MTDAKLIEALIICTILSLLIFRTNYFSNIKLSRAKYTEKGEFNWIMLVVDVMTAMTYSLIGCYLFWDAINNIPFFSEYRIYITPLSILMGLTFQQALPIFIELAMNKLNSLKDKK